MNALHASLSVVLLATSALGADLTVGAPGSGSDFTSIQAAVDAASTGDRVLVARGSFAGSIVITKSLELVGAGSGQTAVSPTVAGGGAPAIAVLDLGAGERVRVVGLGIEPAPDGGATYGNGLFVRDCAGPVTFADVAAVFGLPTAQGDPREVVRLEGSDRVLFDRCRFAGPPSTHSSAGAAEGLSALRALGSRIWINDSSLRGAGGGFKLGGGPGEGGPGIDLSDSELFLSASNVRGGPGRLQPGGPATAAGPGARLGGGSRIELSGPTNLAGGNGVGSGAAAGPGGPGLALLGGSTAVLSGGAGVSGGPGSPAGAFSVEDASSSLFFSPEPQTAIRSSDTLLAAGGTFQVELTGLSMTTFGLFLGFETVAPVGVPGFAGLALIQPSTAFPLATIQTSFLGSATPTISVPPNAPSGLRGYLQAASLGNVIAPSISVPAFVTVE